MANEGFNAFGKIKTYNDFESLKRYIHPAKGRYYKKDKCYEFTGHVSITTTATAQEFESTDSIAISQIGSTELTLLLYGDADNASTLAKTYTLIYKDNLGVSHTAVGTGTATLNATKVAFVPAVADFYEAVSFTPSAADANVNVYAATAAGVIYATVATTETATNADACFGVGTMYCRSHTDHTDADGAVVYIDYLTPWGDYVANANSTLDTAAGTGTDTEIVYRKTTATTVNGVAITSAINANDVWFIVKHWSATTPTVNCHEFITTDSACANVDGSGGDIYAVIKEGEYNGNFTRGRCPTGYDMWVGLFDVNAIRTNAFTDTYPLTLTFFTPNDTIRQIMWFSMDGYYTYEPCMQIKEGTDAYWTMLDTAAATEASILVTYLLCEKVVK